MKKREYSILIGILVFALVLIFIYTFYFNSFGENQSSFGIVEDVASLLTLKVEALSERTYSGTPPDDVCGYENYDVEFLGYNRACFVKYAYGEQLIYGTRGMVMGKMGIFSWDPILKYILPVDHLFTKIDYTYADSGKLCGPCMECKMAPESVKLKEKWDKGDRNFRNGQAIIVKTCQWMDEGDTDHNMCDENCDENEELPQELSAKCVKKEKIDQTSKELECERTGCKYHSECPICEECVKEDQEEFGKCASIADMEYDNIIHTSLENSFGGDEKKPLLVFNLFPPPKKIESGPGCNENYFNGVKAEKDGLLGDLNRVPWAPKGYVCFKGKCAGGLRKSVGEGCSNDNTFIGGDNCKKCLDCVDQKCVEIDGGTDIGMCDNGNNIGIDSSGNKNYICKVLSYTGEGLECIENKA